MSILLFFIILIGIVLNLKIKLHIFFKFDNFDSYFRLKILRKEIKYKGKFEIRKKKNNKKNKQTRIITKNFRKIDLNSIKKFLKYVEVDKLNINVLIGLFLIFPTVFSVPIVSFILDCIKLIQFKNLKEFKYEVMPKYDEIKLYVEIDTILKMRIIDVFVLLPKMISLYFNNRKVSLVRNEKV